MSSFKIEEDDELVLKRGRIRSCSRFSSRVQGINREKVLLYNVNRSRFKGRSRICHLVKGFCILLEHCFSFFRTGAGGSRMMMREYLVLYNLNSRLSIVASAVNFGGRE